MPDSKYPGELDTDKELPRVDNNITEIGSDAINGLRSAVFNLEETLGLDPQGTAADVAARLDQSLAPDGSIKASALTTIGLVALPITNSMIGATAGIEESKLDLDYSTVQLKTWIDENRVRIISLENKVAVDINNLTQHVAHPSTHGRHHTSDIDGYVAPYASQNLQGIVTDIRGRIDDHIAEPTDAHDASAISVDPTEFLFITAIDGQDAFEQLDELGVRALVQHQDRQHSNGILRTQETFLPGTNRNVVIVASAAATVVEGVNRVIFSAAQATLATAARGDVVDVTLGSNTYKLRVDEIVSNTVVNTVNPSPASGTGTAIVYRTAEETSEPANLIVAAKKAASSGEVLQLVQPAAPFLVSSGLDVRSLTAGVQNIRVGWASGNTGDIDVLAAMTAFSADPSNWTPENLTQVLNDTFTTAGDPLIAFHYKGELGLAFDEPEGTLTALAPSGGSTAWEALGFSQGEVAQSLEERKFYIDGYEFAHVRKIVSTTGTIVNGSDTIVAAINLDDLGIKENGIVRVKNSTSDDGTWIFDQVLSTNLNVLHNFSTNETVTIDIYADYFGITTPTDRTFYELFVDGYQFITSQLRGTRRAVYENAAGTPNNPESWFDIVAVSRTFRTNANKRIAYESRVVTLGDRSGAVVINPGAPVTIPSSNSEGFRFKLYDNTGVDYVEIEIAADPGTNNINHVDLEIFDRISEELYVQVGTVLHNTLRFKHLEDLRLFGNVGRQDVRDDFTRDNVTYPRSLLRAGGIIRGFDVTGTTSVDVGGGEVLANGTVFPVSGKSVVIPENGAVITYNLFVDGDGSLQMLEDGFYTINVLTTPTLAEILNSDDKTIIAQVDVGVGDTVTAIRDLRRFVNNLDNKIDLIVEENQITHGSFASLQAAVNYINGWGVLPVPARIRVRGTINLEIAAATDTIVLPAGVMLEGDNLVDSVISVTNNTAFSTIIPGNGCTIKDLGFETDSATLTSAFIGGLSSDIVGLRVERCRFVFNTVNANNYAIAADDMSVSKISNCMFTQPGRGVYCDNSMTNSVVSDCAFNDVVDNAIYLVGASQTVISGNMVTKSTGADANTAFISITNSTETIIEKNILSTTSAVAALGSMIAIINNAGTTTNIHIKNNILKNTGASAVGIAVGINLGASSYGGIQDVIVSGNTVWGFYGAATSHGVLSSGVIESIINSNHVSKARFALKMAGSNSVIVTDNYLSGEENVSVVVFDWTQGSSGGQILFANNYVTNNEATFLGASNDVVSFIETAGFLYNCVIHGNTIEAFATNQDAALLNIEGDGFIINDNKFYGQTFNPGHNPIEISGNDNLITDNSFVFITSAVSGMIGDTGNGNVDSMNKGQTYYAILGASRFTAPWVVNVTLGGATDFYPSISITKEKIDVGNDTTGQLGAIEFTNTDVPVGAELVRVEVYAEANTALGDLSAILVAAAWNVTSPNGRIVSASANPAASPGIITLTPLVTEYMNDTEIFAIRFETHASNLTYIHGARITYTL